MRNQFLFAPIAVLLSACAPQGTGFTGIGAEPASVVQNVPIEGGDVAVAWLEPSDAAQAFSAPELSTTRIKLAGQTLRMDLRQDDLRRYAVLLATSGGVVTREARVEFARVDYVLTGCRQASDWVSSAGSAGTAVALDCA